MKIKYKLKQIYKDIWLVEAAKFDLAMIFFRVQEYYENPKYMNKDVSFFEVMRYYANKENGKFKYANEYVGFNVPSDFIERFFIKSGFYGEYDDALIDILNRIKEVSYGDYYLIGAVKDDTPTRNHELAHAFYFLNSDYKNEMDNLIDSLPNKTIKKVNRVLKGWDYHKSVRRDEIQAYGVSAGPDNIRVILKDYRPKFKKIFKKYI